MKVPADWIQVCGNCRGSGRVQHANGNQIMVGACPKCQGHGAYVFMHEEVEIVALESPTTQVVETAPYPPLP